MCSLYVLLFSLFLLFKPMEEPSELCSGDLSSRTKFISLLSFFISFFYSILLWFCALSSWLIFITSDWRRERVLVCYLELYLGCSPTVEGLLECIYAGIYYWTGIIGLSIIECLLCWLPSIPLMLLAALVIPPIFVIPCRFGIMEGMPLGVEIYYGC